MFNRKQKLSLIIPTDKIKYPIWTILKQSDEYFIVTGTKAIRKLISQRAALSWSAIPVLTSKEALVDYVLTGRAGFRPGTILKSVVNGSCYFIGGTQIYEALRMQILTPDFWSVALYDKASAVEVSLNELYFHKEGESIDNV